MSLIREIDFKTYNTRRNLPGRTGRKRGEANFLGAFSRALVEEVQPPSVYGRYFAMPGCGVADFVLCEGFDNSSNVGNLHTSLLAFEAKLTDWRQAIQQAYRYRYYADSAFVLLPAKNASAALRNGRLFETFGIGLWTFDVETKTIEKYIAPSSTQVLNLQKREEALGRIFRRITNLRKFGKRL